MAKPSVICNILPPSRWDRTGVLRAMSLVYAAGFLKHGVRTHFIEFDGPRFPTRLAAALRKPEVGAAYSIGSWGVDAQILGATPQNVLERSGKPFIGHHGDYPFSPWVVQKLKHDFPRRITLYHDERAPGFATEMMETRGVHAHAAQAYCDFGFHPQRSATPPSRRPIRLLYVGKHLTTDRARKLVAEKHPAYIQVYEALYEQGLREFRRPIWEVCAEAHAANGMPFDPRHKRSHWLLYYAYEAIRSQRRATALERLGRHAMHLVLGGDGAMPPQHARSVVQRAISFHEVLRMIDQARAVIVVQPNHSHGITERTLTAMHRRSVVVSTPNAFLDANFAAGEDYLRLDGGWENLDEQIASLDDARRTDAIAEAGWRRVVGRFSPEATASRYLEFLDPERPAPSR